MSDGLTDDTKAIMLLCGVFGKNRSEKPLTQKEYTSIVHWLISKKMRPGDLLQKDHIAEASKGAAIDRPRLEALIDRGVQLGFAVEEWQRNGIWIISRSDSDYPARYKKHLKEKAPPLLFGVGQRDLLNGGGLGIVGSRNVDREGEAFTRHVAELCAFNDMPVVSGGARGVDQFAMSAVLEAGGVAIGILADNLLKKSLERSARHAISDGRLLLLSPYHPNARFTVGTAMARNKLIYALADYGLVVSAEHKKGGTWAGAEEELKRDISLPVFVRSGSHTPPGNSKLLELGAIAWPETIERDNLKQQLADLSAQPLEKPDKENLTLFDLQEMPEPPSGEAKPEMDVEAINHVTPRVEPEPKTEDGPGSIYQAVLPILLNELETPATIPQLVKSLDVVKKQLDLWMKKAVDEKRVIKLSRPVRYQRVRSEKQV